MNGAAQSKSTSFLRNRKGFALILVFSLASVVLLIGLSLVSLTQVETASSQYDQGMRVARANARLALQMALGDLQTFGGADQRVSATADGMRNDTDRNFNNAEDGATSGVYQPFWTGFWDATNLANGPIWLVTRPLDEAYEINSPGLQNADPFASDLGTAADTVKLMGAGSAKPENPSSGQVYHDVLVPKMAVASANILGLEETEEASIGHYAYWVGDNGVKASYLLEDNVPETLHDVYEDSASPGDPSYEQRRLEQMLGHRHYLKVDSREVDASDERIGSIVTEMALRHEEDAATGLSFLGSYTQNDVRRRFHDFTGVSRGLLADPIRGGLKVDLSNIHAVSTGAPSIDNLVNNYLMPYLNVEDIAASATLPTELTRSYSIAPKNAVFGGGGPTPAIAPVITEFHLLIHLRGKDLEIGSPSTSIYSLYGATIELWNPYSSRLEGTDLRIRIDNPNTSGLAVTYYDNGAAQPNPAVIGLDDIMDDVAEFQLDATGISWEPGEVRVFTGAYLQGSGLNLVPGTQIPVDVTTLEFLVDDLPVFTSSDEVYTDDRISLEGPSWSPEISMRMASGELLRTSSLDSAGGLGFYEMKSPAKILKDPNPLITQPHLSYKWELRNPDSSWQNYDPRTGLITGSVIMDDFDDPSVPPPGYDPTPLLYFEYPGADYSWLFSAVQSSATDLLAADLAGSERVETNIPLFELPRQDFLSLGALHAIEFPSGIRSQLGASSDSISPEPSINEIFDRFFLSTVPQSGTTNWSVGNPLPNSRVELADNPSLSDLQDPESAEHLFVRGLFNVNSTSVEAWEAVLKGVRLQGWAYDDPAGTNPVAGQETEDLTDGNQFFRFTQSAEETWRGTYNADDLDASRELFREGLRSLSDPDIDALATEIVRLTRERRQSSGPFVSLEDFIDAGILEDAIAATTINSGIEVGSIPLTYASSYLTQQDVLAAIGPFLSTRSDTFVIRAYGDAVDPFDPNRVLARAYCEAVAQRVHQKHSTEYEDISTNEDPMVPTMNLNGRLGREFRIVAFRWMTADEI